MENERINLLPEENRWHLELGAIHGLLTPMAVAVAATSATYRLRRRRNGLMHKATEPGLEFQELVQMDEGAIRYPIRNSPAEMAYGIDADLTLSEHPYHSIGAEPYTPSQVIPPINESIDARVFARRKADAKCRYGGDFCSLQGRDG